MTAGALNTQKAAAAIITEGADYALAVRDYQPEPKQGCQPFPRQSRGHCRSHVEQHRKGGTDVLKSAAAGNMRM